MFIVNNRVGKLIEVRISTPTDLEEALRLQADVAACLGRIRGQAVSCGDFRQMRVVAPELANAFSDMLRRDNKKIARNGYLVNGSAILGLQLERVLKEAQHPARRAFRERDDLQRWLGEVLDEQEQRRLAEFLDEGSSL